jgi:hypothetical protein
MEEIPVTDTYCRTIHKVNKILKFWNFAFYDFLESEIRLEGKKEQLINFNHISL